MRDPLPRLGPCHTRLRAFRDRLHPRPARRQQPAERGGGSEQHHRDRDRQRVAPLQVIGRAGRERGRIYRVYPVGAKLRPLPWFDRLTSAELVTTLASPSGWLRDTAQRRLIDRFQSS